MSKAASYPKVTNLNDLLAIAYQIEIDAVERYTLLADQMETHNNPELVAIEARQVNTDNIFGDYPLRGLDDQFLENTSYRMAAMAEGYASPAEVWAALKNGQPRQAA